MSTHLPVIVRVQQRSHETCNPAPSGGYRASITDKKKQNTVSLGETGGLCTIAIGTHEYLLGRNPRANPPLVDTRAL